MSDIAQQAAPEAEAPPYRWRWAAFAVVLAGSVMDLLDSLATNIAGPSIRADIGGGSTLLQWLLAGYTLAMAVGLITGGRLGDLYGRRPVLLVGMAGFTIGSILCSIATQPGELIAFRVVQGLFGAIMLPQGLGVIRASFPPRELPAAFGAFGPVMGLSSVGGPVLAGWLIGADYLGTGWRMIFLINAPIGLAAFLAGLRFLPRTQEITASRLDIVGAVLVAAAAGLLVYPVVQGRELGWPAWTFLLMVASVVVFTVFGWYEIRMQRRGREPLVIPGLFAKRAFTGGLICGLTFFTALVGFSLVLTVYLQLGLGYSPLKAGLTVLPQALGSVAGFVAAGAGLAAKLGRTLIHAGTAAIALGLGRRLPDAARSHAAADALAARTRTRPQRHRDGPCARPVLRHHPGRRRTSRDRLGVGGAHRHPAVRERTRGGRPRDRLLRPAYPEPARPREPAGVHPHPRTDPLGRRRIAGGHLRARLPATATGATPVERHPSRGAA